MRYVILDTETTGFEPELGHKLVEIGAVEMIDRQLTGRHFHHYLNPERDSDEGALAVHGLTTEFLSDKPLFFAINSYTEGLSPAVMEYVLKTTLCPKVGGHTSCDEIGLPVTATGGVVPCGATAVWEE